MYPIDNTVSLPDPWKGELWSFFALKHDDLTIDIYYPKPGVESNKVWVDAIDTVVGTVSGRFNVTLRKAPREIRGLSFRKQSVSKTAHSLHGTGRSILEQLNQENEMDFHFMRSGVSSKEPSGYTSRRQDLCTTIGSNN